jgi:hypothetical protein
MLIGFSSDKVVVFFWKNHYTKAKKPYIIHTTVNQANKIHLIFRKTTLWHVETIIHSGSSVFFMFSTLYRPKQRYVALNRFAVL